jgi:hypothetical protein
MQVQITVSNTPTLEEDHKDVEKGSPAPSQSMPHSLPCIGGGIIGFLWIGLSRIFLLDSLQLSH